MVMDDFNKWWDAHYGEPELENIPEALISTMKAMHQVAKQRAAHAWVECHRRDAEEERQHIREIRQQVLTTKTQ